VVFSGIRVFSIATFVVQEESDFILAQGMGNRPAVRSCPAPARAVSGSSFRLRVTAVIQGWSLRMLPVRFPSTILVPSVRLLPAVSAPHSSVRVQVRSLLLGSTHFLSFSRL
jgi:hypothetical protein